MMLQVLAVLGLLAGSPATGGPPSTNAGVVTYSADLLADRGMQSGQGASSAEPSGPGAGRADYSSAEMPAGLQAGPWPGFRQNAAHTGRSSLSGPLHPWQSWAYDMGGSTYSSPAVADDGTIYIGSADSIYALSPDGRRRWATAIGGYAISSPAIGANGTVYVGSRDGRLYALQSRTGLPVWAPFETGDEVWSSPTIASDGTVYVGSFDGNLYAINASTGSPRWAYSIGSDIGSSPAVGTDGTIYVGSLDGHLYAINRDGTERWFFATGGDVVSSPAIAPNGTVYVGSLDGGLYAVGRDGTAQWTSPFQTGDQIASSPAIGADGTIYVGSVDGNLYAVNPDGTARWTFEADSEIYSSPAVDVEGIIYFGSYGGRLYAIQPDGTPRWSINLRDHIWSSPAIATRRTLYVATTNDEMFTGRLHSIGSVSFEADFRTDPIEGTAQVVDVSAPEDFVPTSGRLFYRRGGERTFRGPVPLRTGQDSYEGDIPAEDVTLRGIEYYVELTDGNTTVTYPPVAPRTNPAFRTVRLGQTVEANLELAAARYAMVSVPLGLNDPSVQSVLEDDYGPYTPSLWRLLRWENGSYREHPAIAATFTPGTAFFLNVRSGRAFDVDDGEAVDPSIPFRITLQPGWNQVANPFAFPVPLDEIVRDPTVVSAIAYWNGAEMCQEPSCIDVWKPWEGYFMFNDSDEPVSIYVRGREAEAEDSTAFTSAVAASSGATLVRLVASVQGTSMRDSQNWIGFSGRRDEATSDMFEAPPFGEHVRLSVMDNDSRYVRRLKPLSEEGARWEVRLSVSDRGAHVVDVNLLEEHRSLPDEFRAYVLDHDNNEIIPVVDGRFTVNTERARPHRQLSLFIGTDSYREAVLGDTPVRAATFALEQNYPNPFNPQTTIGYALEQKGHVVLDVYDAVGRRVRTLVDKNQDAGHHSVVWDGRSNQGENVASGLYFYQITTKTSTQTRTMLLLR